MRFTVPAARPCRPPACCDGGEIADLAVVRTGGFCATGVRTLQRRAAASLTAFLESGGRPRLTPGTALIGSAEVEFDDEAAFANINTIDELQCWSATEQHWRLTTAPVACCLSRPGNAELRYECRGPQETHLHPATDAAAARSIVWFPQFANQKSIDRFRGLHDPQAQALPPHLTLVFPFHSTIDAGPDCGACAEGAACLALLSGGDARFWSAQNEFIGIGTQVGTDALVEMHDRLYRGPLEEFLRP